MNKKNNRKGFTIVELVIVIAVIAILATVLVPTFGNVIGNANNTALIQEIKNEHTNYTVTYATKEFYDEDVTIKIGDKYYEFASGSIKMDKDANNNEYPHELTTTEINALTDYYDAATDKLMHKYEAVGGDGSDKTYCKHCVATEEHTTAAETTK